MLNFFVMLLLGASFFPATTSSPWLLISTEEEVKIVDAQTPDKSPAHLVSNGVKPDAYLYYLDYHYQDGLVCWSDITELTVQCLQHNVSGLQSKEPTVFVSELTYPVGVAVDWLADALYWADSKAGTIEVILLQSPHYRRVLYWANLADINDIAVLPTQGLLFWSKWGVSPLIEVASMAGSDEHGDDLLGASRRPLVSSGLNWPNGIAVDGARELLYWADAWKEQPYIEAVAFDGSRRFKILNKELLHPFALSYFDNSLYWTDWETHAIHTCSLGVQGKCGVPRRIGSSNTTKSVRVYTPELQHSSSSRSCSSPPCEPAPSPCSPSPCSHLCLLAPSPDTRRELLSNIKPYHGPKSSLISTGPSFSCTCPTGITLEADGRTCGDGPQEFLLLARHGGLFRVSLDTPDHSLLPLDALGRDNETRHDAVEVDYDPVRDEIYWVDDELKAVRATREFSSGAVATRTVLEELGSADGFALDVRGRNLYWTDEARQRIHVAPMDGSARMVLVWTDLYQPRALALHSQRALLFWTDWGAVPKIERSTVAGEDRTVLVNKDIAWPNGIAVDEEKDTVYWVDGRLEIIESIGVDGTGRRVVLRDRLQHLDGLSLLGPRLYWLDRSERAVASASFDGTERHDLVRNVRFIQDIKAVRRDHKLPEEGSAITELWTGLPSPCAHNRGGCSHLCFNTASGGHSCRCPSELEMSADEQTCMAVPAADGGFLVYGGSKNGLHRLSLTPPYLSEPLPLTPLRATVSVSFDPVEGLVYRSDSESKSVRRSRLDGSMSQPVLRHGLVLPQALAVDHINRNLYWLDMVLNRLEVSRLDGSSRRVLVWRDIGKPYSIAVEPVIGTLFWFELGSEHGSEHGVIKSAWLDGSNVRSLVTKDLGQKVAIAVQPPTMPLDGWRGPQPDLLSQTRLYWTDSDMAKIESCDANGRDRRVLVQADAGSVDGGIVGAAVWGGRVYWAQKLGHSYALRSANASTGANPFTVKSGLNMTDIMLTVARQHNSSESAATGDAAADGSTAVEGPDNPCVLNYGGCSHLCLPPPITALGSEGSRPSPCACPTHYTLDVARKTCLPPRSFLVYGVKSGISRLLGADSASTADCSDDDLCPTVELAIRGVRFVAALTYDPVEHIVYWLDKKSKKVWAAQEHAFKKQIVIDNPVDAVHPHSLAIDYVTGQLFLSCAQHNTINVTQRGRTKEGQIVYLNLGCVVGLPSDSPRALAVHSPLRRLFFVNMVSPVARLESCRLDGSRRTVLIDTGLTEPAALTVDTRGTAPRLYWFDVRPNRIESATLDGRDRRVSVSGGLERVVALAVLRNVLYWVDAGTNLVQRGDVRYPNHTRTTVLSRLSDLVDIVAVDVDQAQQPHLCSRSGVNQCSQVCLMTTVNQTAGVGDSPYLGRSDSFYSAFGGSGGGSGHSYGAGRSPKATTRQFGISGGVTQPSNMPRSRSDNGYHDPYREHSGVNRDGSGGEYNSRNYNLHSGGVRSGSSSDPNIRRRSYGITVSSSNLMSYDSSKAAYGRSSYVPSGATTSAYSPSSAGYYTPGVEGACGCLYGEVLAADGWSCKPCLQQHFTCSHEPLICLPQHHRCDGVKQCWNGSDEADCPPLVTPCEGGACVSSSVSGEVFRTPGGGSSKTAYIVGVVASVFVFLCVAAALVYYRRRPPLEDALALAATSAGLKTQQHQLLPRGAAAAGKGGYRPPAGSAGGSSCQRLLPESSTGCSVGCLNGSCGSSCAAPHHNGGIPSHIIASEMFSLTPATGAHASSSSSSTTHYPKETVNPPPTPTSRQAPSGVCYNNCYHLLPPATSSNLASSGCIQGQNPILQQGQAGRAPHHLVYYPQGRCIPPVSSQSSAHFLPLAADHSYRHYKTRNRPPPPTPCSTDICDDSDINSTILVTSTPSYSSDTNEQLHPHKGGRHHQHPNSPNAQYCSLSSLPRTDYYGDSEPEPPPPTPQLPTDRGSPTMLSSPGGLEGECREVEDAASGAMVSPTSQQKDGLLITSSPGRSGRRFYCPPPPSPIASD